MPIAFPSVGVQNMSMRLKRAVSVSNSPFTYSQQVFEHQGARWEAEVSLPPLSHSEARAVEAFIVALKGQSGTFTFGHPLHTSSASATTPATLAVRSESFTTDAGSSAIDAGTYFELDGYLYLVTEDKAAGANVLNFQPPTRTSITSATALDFTLPKSTWRMASNDIGWSTDTASIYGFTFACVEAI